MVKMLEIETINSKGILIISGNKFLTKKFCATIFLKVSIIPVQKIYSQLPKESPWQPLEVAVIRKILRKIGKIFHTL